MNILKTNIGLKKKSLLINSGFTLVELLIVIGILAVLAAVVIVAINPVQNLAKTRDAGRVSSVTQIGRALESNFTNSGTGRYLNPAAACTGSGATWIACLTSASGGSGELNSVPALVSNILTASCAGTGMGVTGGAQNGWCYKVGALGAAPMIVYSRLEASANVAKCPTPATDFVYALYSSADGKSGVVCSANEAALATGTQTFR